MVYGPPAVNARMKGRLPLNFRGEAEWDVEYKRLTIDSSEVFRLMEELVENITSFTGSE